MRARARFVGSTWIVLGVALATGCRKSPPPLVEAQGTITLDGKPLPRASIMLFPTFKGFGSDLIAAATSDDEGRFRLECGVGKGACAGAYIATVTEYPVPPDMMRSSRTGDATIRQFYDKLPNRPIPVQFGDPTSSPVRIEIVKDQGEYEIVLTR